MYSLKARTLLAGFGLLFVFVGRAAAADLSGAWGLQFERNDSPELYQGECTFKHEGDRLSGSCLSGFESIVPVTGNVKGAVVTFQFTVGVESGTTAVFSGQLDHQETSIKGTWRFVDQRGNKGEGIFTATKR